jgi:hypothetical protein
MNTITSELTQPTTETILGQPQSPAAPQGSGNPSSIEHHPAIARLPKATRDMINLMLEDALPYRVILDELAETGSGLTAQSLAQWVQTGHQQHLQNRQSIEAARSSAEFAADLVRELRQIEPSVVHRASMSVVAIQIFDAIREHGEKALTDMLRAKPASIISLMNVLCNLTNTSLKIEVHRVTEETSAGKG